MFYTTNYKSKDDLFTGKLPYRLTNDYLFRAVFQTRPKALEGLCRAVLRLKPEDTLSVTLQNPIKLGTRIDNKEFVLDLAVIINNVLFLNLEMQVYHEAFWKERSLSYTCRSFDQLNHGENYNTVLPVVHVGFLNYSLFPEYPEFFATYELANTSNPNYSYLYSDKLRISVVDLTQIELATEDDKCYDIDLWARVFTATTWEEIEMLAQNNEYLKEAVSGVRQLTEDEQIRQQCQAREDFEYWERIRNNYVKELGDNLEQTQDRLEQTQGELEQTQDELEQTQDELEQTQDELNQIKDELQQANDIISQKDAELTKALARIAELEAKN
ncbi:MAG: PD-(D/E)XK nuclease family transposase [Lachnospiraceae bacterium]|nr:PD-(D/E)XK nuclease family transposase [Lachnospiraceae bacterium]